MTAQEPRSRPETGAVVSGHSGWMDVAATAEYLGISPNHVLRLCARKRAAEAMDRAMKVRGGA